MPHWDFPRNVISMRLMAELAVDIGISLAEVLAGTDVTPAQLVDPELLVSGRQELQLIRNLVRHAGDVPGLGIQAGMRYHFTAFGVLGFALVSSRSVRSALDVGLQYIQLTFTFSRFVVSEQGDEALLQLMDDEVPEDVAAFVVERDMSAVITVSRDLYDDAPVLRDVRLRAAEPADTHTHERFFRLRPRFGAGENAVAFDRARMEQSLQQANEQARQAAMAQCQSLLATRKARSGLAATVRDRLVTLSAQMPTMADVADALCLTVRTLRRRLLAEGVTFAELREEVRMTLADELLSGPRLSVEQIAERLGYAEPTSFINAFKRWYGTTPHVFRRRGTSAAV